MGTGDPCPSSIWHGGKHAHHNSHGKTPDSFPELARIIPHDLHMVSYCSGKGYVYRCQWNQFKRGRSKGRRRTCHMQTHVTNASLNAGCPWFVSLCVHHESFPYFRVFSTGIALQGTRDIAWEKDNCGVVLLNNKHASQANLRPDPVRLMALSIAE